MYTRKGYDVEWRNWFGFVYCQIRYVIKRILHLGLTQKKLGNLIGSTLDDLPRNFLGDCLFEGNTEDTNEIPHIVHILKACETKEGAAILTQWYNETILRRNKK